MASSKRQPSKNKRYRQNKAERTARAARSAHAGEATAIAAGAREPVSAPTAAKAKAPADKAGRARPNRQSPYTQPGQRAVVFAFMFSLAAAILLVFTTQTPKVTLDEGDPRIDDAKEIVSENEDDGTVTILENRKLVKDEAPVTVAFVLLVPPLVAGAALYFSKHPKKVQIWTMCMLVMFGAVLFFGVYGFLYLPAAAALAWAGFQARRAENAPKIAELKAQRAARKAAKTSDVIDVDPVDED